MHLPDLKEGKAFTRSEATFTFITIHSFFGRSFVSLGRSFDGVFYVINYDRLSIFIHSAKENDHAIQSQHVEFKFTFEKTFIASNIVQTRKFSVFSRCALLLCHIMKMIHSIDVINIGEKSMRIIT